MTRQTYTATSEGTQNTTGEAWASDVAAYEHYRRNGLGVGTEIKVFMHTRGDIVLVAIYTVNDGGGVSDVTRPSVTEAGLNAAWGV